MSILLAAEGEPAAPWIAGLGEAFPHLPVRLPEDAGGLADVRYAIVWQPPAGLLAGLGELRAVLNLGAGIDGVLGDATLPSAVPVVRMVVPGLTQMMVEYVVWQVMDWHRGGPHYRRSQQARVWAPRRERPAGDVTVGVLGLGELGCAAATALARLGFRVAGWSRGPRTVAGVETLAGAAGLMRLLPRCDCLVCLLPLTPETRGLIDARLLAALPAGGHLVNAGRGALVVDDDLLAALDRGRPGSAALDVFAREPLADDHPYWTHPAVSVTPHVASQTLHRDALPWAVETIRTLEAGGRPAGLVDRGRGY